jgi:hypothetical protein
VVLDASLLREDANMLSAVGLDPCHMLPRSAVNDTCGCPYACRSWWVVLRDAPALREGANMLSAAVLCLY